jgi:protocatechuate 3,4-dioxygenase beta subunit
MSLLIALALAGVLAQPAAAPHSAALAGRVLEEGTHAPIAGVQVTLMEMRNRPMPSVTPLPPTFPFVRPATATTDQDGRFQFSGLQPGSFRVHAEKVGFAAVSGAEPPAIDLKGGEQRDGVEITLQRGAVIAGRVLDASGDPIADARVMAFRKPPAARQGRGGPALVPAPSPGAQTDDLGEFRLHSLPPGEYFVQASPRPMFPGALAPGAAATATTTSTTTLLTTFFPGTSDPAAAQSISVSAGQTARDVEIRLIVASAFHVTGLVVDDAGRPIEGAMVMLAPGEAGDPPGMMMRMGPPNRARTDASGAFTIANVTNGSYTLTAAAPLVMSAPAARGGGGGSGGFTSFVQSGRMSGSVGGWITTETTNGTTVQFREDTATKVPVTVNEANVTGLQIVAHRPAR